MAGEKAWRQLHKNERWWERVRVIRADGTTRWWDDNIRQHSNLLGFCSNCSPWLYWCFYLLYIDLWRSQPCHSKDGGSAYSIGVGELSWQYGTGLKSCGPATNWCTRREWPVSCMTVISARWQSNMPFQGQRKWHILMASYGEILSEWMNYFITRWRQEVSEFGDQTYW